MNKFLACLLGLLFITACAGKGEDSTAPAAPSDAQEEHEHKLAKPFLNGLWLEISSQGKDFVAAKQGKYWYRQAEAKVEERAVEEALARAYQPAALRILSTKDGGFAL